MISKRINLNDNNNNNNNNIKKREQIGTKVDFKIGGYSKSKEDGVACLLFNSIFRTCSNLLHDRSRE